MFLELLFGKEVAKDLAGPSTKNQINSDDHNSDQRQIRTENQIRIKDKFGPIFEIRPKLIR